MAKATDTITLTAVRDIESVTWYYQLKAGTSAPAKPTVSPPPSPWQTAEPSYTAGDTKYLFVVERTVYTDGTFDYTVPTMSSSYEAAKLAYIEAQTAKKTATNFMSADSLGIMVADMRTSSSQTPSNPRGRNVLIDNDSVDIRKGSDVLASFGESTVIGQAEGWHQRISSEETVYAYGETVYTYLTPGKILSENFEVKGSYYVGDYSVRVAGDGKLVIGRRK